MRLIDADALECDAEWSEYADDYISYSKFAIDNAPTIDAVPRADYEELERHFVNWEPVVRCKDCEWYVRSIIKQDGTLDKRYKPDWCDLYRKVREETYFCADGERKDDE